MYNPETDSKILSQKVSPLAPATRFNGVFPLMNWGAIFAGLVAGLATYILLTLMGIATGLSALDITAQGTGIDNISTWTTAWNGLAMLLSAFVGGYVAARMSGLRRKLDGVMHGIVVWAATTLLFVVLSASATAKIFGGAFSSLIQPSSSATATQGNDNASVLLERLRSSLMPNINASALTNENMQRLQTMIANHDRQGAIDFMTLTLGVDAAQSTEMVDRLLVASGSTELASPQTRSEMNKTVDVASAALWILFFAVLLSAASSIAGGMMGVRNMRRVRRTTTSSSQQPVTT